MPSRAAHPSRSHANLKAAELRRLDRGVVELEALALRDPILRPMLAAARACRAEIARDRRT